MDNFNKGKKTRSKRSLTKVINKVSSRKMVFKPNNANTKTRHIQFIDKSKNLSDKAKEFDAFVQGLLQSKKSSDTGKVNAKNHKLLIFNYDRGFSSKNIFDSETNQFN